MYWSNVSRPYKTDRASFSICAQFLSDGDNALDTYSTIRDDLLEAELHRLHVCYHPLESQPLLQHPNRLGMVILKGFSLSGKSVLTFCGRHEWSVLPCQSTDWFKCFGKVRKKPRHLMCHTTQAPQTCYINRFWHVADSFHFGFINFNTILCDCVTMEGNFS